jgi:predicted TIM-barrel fold metal-dependent hydrolase
MTVDGLSFLGTSRFGYQREPAELLDLLSTEGIDTALVAPMHPRDGDFDTANKEIAAIVRDHPDRLIAIARVDPWDGDDAIIQLTDAVTNGGAKGVFLHPGEENFQINDTRWRPIAGRAAELGVPVLVSTGHHCRSEAGQVASFAEWCPGIPVIMTNGGQLNISGLGQVDAELALALPNVHIFTSGVYRDDFLERAVRTFGADRVLFASFAPQFDVGYERRRVHQVHISAEERALVLSGNAQRLFGIGANR